MTSRLDRLFILLESGSSAVTRRAAARQIGEVQKLHPHELHNLLNRLIVYLHSASWDTRIAAAQAVDAILANVPQWSPSPQKEELWIDEDYDTYEYQSHAQLHDNNTGSLHPSAAATAATSAGGGDQNYRLTFASFDVRTVLQRGARLMGSEGSEFDHCLDEHELDSREHLQRQRAALNEKLGFSNGATLGINFNDLVTLDDMRLHTVPCVSVGAASTSPSSSSLSSNCSHGGGGGGGVQNNQPNDQRLMMPVQEILRQQNVAAADAAALSCREMNRAKRKARQLAAPPLAPLSSSSTSSTSSTSVAPITVVVKVMPTTASSSGNGCNEANHNNSIQSISSDSTDESGNGLYGESARKYAKLELKNEVMASRGSNEAVPDGTGSWEYSTDWPLETFCARLYLDLFSTRWETRHGAATALRELLKSHSSGAGKRSDQTAGQMAQQHQRWLEDAVLRLLCVLALDRFGDFVSDQVVAPVRETCAQVLGAILKEMPVEKVRSTVDILLSLVHQPEWEVRHGGLLGIKYMLVVREDLLPVLLPLAIDQILAGLFDAVDDVGAVAAATLIPIAAWLPRLLTAGQVSAIVKMLWDLLLDQDELTSASNSFMGLLSAIVSLQDANKWLQMEPMDMLIPRLWPFLSHNTSTVRRSTLHTLKTLTEITTTNFTISAIIASVDTNGGSKYRPTMPTAKSAVPLGSIDLDRVLHAPPDRPPLELNFGVKHWSPSLLQEALRHIYQRVLVEHLPDIQLLVESVWANLVNNAELSALLHAACPYVASWMCLAMQPARLPFDPTQLIFAKPMQPQQQPPMSSRSRSGHQRFHELDGASQATNANATATATTHKVQQPKMYLGGIETTPLDVRERNVPRARCKAAKMIGLLSRYLVLPAPGVQYSPAIDSPINCYAKILVGYLGSRSALQRLIAGMIVAHWAHIDPTATPGPPQLQQRLNASLLEYFYYDEVAVSLTRLLQEARDLVATMKQNRILVGDADLMDASKILTLDQIHHLSTTLTENLRGRFAMRPKIADMLDERRRGLQQSFAQTSAEQSRVNVSTQAVLAGAAVLMGCLPDKLNPVIKPIMESLKREECEILQQQSAHYLVRLLDQIGGRLPCPNNKIVTNLCTLLRSDAEYTPWNRPGEVATVQLGGGGVVDGANDAESPFFGIVTLENQHKTKATQPPAATATATASNGNGHASSSSPSTASQTLGQRGPGRPPGSASAAGLAVDAIASGSSSSCDSTAAAASAANVTQHEQQEEQKKQQTNRMNRIQRLGATFALREICSHFGASLRQRVPILWSILDNIRRLEGESVVASVGGGVGGEHVDAGWSSSSASSASSSVASSPSTSSGNNAVVTVDYAAAYELITALQLCEVMAPHVHAALHAELFELVLAPLGALLRHPLRNVRHMAARCLATLAGIDPAPVMQLIVDRGVAQLQDIGRVIDRQGAAEAIACIVARLQFRIVPYVILLVVPLLGRMSDSDQAVRLMSTHSFATLIQLMPLDGGGAVGGGGAAMKPSSSSSVGVVGDAKSTAFQLPPLSDELMQRKAKDKEFLEYLFTPKKIPNIRIPSAVQAELRGYQQAGVNWLWFLNRYKLHGILCDDMGLGKTLQTICLLAGAQHERNMEGKPAMASLVICPPTLTGHWVYEVSKFLPSTAIEEDRLLRALHYVGQPVDRERLRRQWRTHNLVVASYDIVRKDIEFFGAVQWNYVVLDEGHIIKNGKTKSSKAIKQLVANHRLILSGTPIQNNVLELWSLFDFLMPGFLGTEKQFVARFARPILASRDAKSSARDQEAGVMAMESLHRQVLPFLLRRVKEDVLKDLPPKITQDLMCELSPLQERLYEDFSRSQQVRMNGDLRECLAGLSGGATAGGGGVVEKQRQMDAAAAAAKKTHVFQALRYLQNVCNHPKLVLTAQHPERERIAYDLQRAGGSLDDIEHSAKLPALRQLLLDCGIGTGEDVSVNQHRALIFCQLKAMLDIVERDLLRRHMPTVSYLRLDGSVAPSARHNIVTKFNSDPSIDVLLLTTQVGGLGLNLTGADTVIFVEHDWNPMKDLQAMDRAHRIGQRKVVNVYRLITRKSLEEKIMGLQKFKLITANTIVSDENAAMETMQTDQLFDLFNLDDRRPAASSAAVSGTTAMVKDGAQQQLIGESAASLVTMKQALETLPELWEDQQYEEEYDMSQFLLNMK